MLAYFYKTILISSCFRFTGKYKYMKQGVHSLLSQQSCVLSPQKNEFCCESANGASAAFCHANFQTWGSRDFNRIAELEIISFMSILELAIRHHLTLNW